MAKSSKPGVENSALDKKVDKALKLKEGSKLDQTVDRQEQKVMGKKSPQAQKGMPQPVKNDKMKPGTETRAKKK